jgi:hypothetical protein
MITIKCKNKVAEAMLVNELMKYKNIEVAMEDAGEFIVNEAAAHDAASAEIKDMIKKGVGYDREIRDLVHKVGKQATTGEYETVVDHAKALSDVAKEAHKNAKGLHDAGWAFPHWKKLVVPNLSKD